MKVMLYFLILFFIISCTPLNNKKGDINYITKNGELLVSVFKKDFKNNRGSYHVWTKDAKKNKEQVDSIREELGLLSDYTIYLYSDSTLDEGHYYAYCLDYFKMNPIQKFHNEYSNEIYIEDKDTIAFLSSEPNGVYNLYTSRKLTSKDISFIKNAVGSLKLYDINTAFLYEEKTNNPGEEFYGSYNGRVVSIKSSPNKKIESIIKDLNEGIKINSIVSIILFQDQIKKGEKLLSECDDKSMCDKLRKALSAFQKKHFPLARKMYYNNAKEKLWEKNIEVKLSGRDITFEGYMFADNGTIKATYEEIRKELEDLRFKTVGFRWYEGGDRTYWKLNVKNDGEI